MNMKKTTFILFVVIAVTTILHVCRPHFDSTESSQMDIESQPAESQTSPQFPEDRHHSGVEDEHINSNVTIHSESERIDLNDDERPQSLDDETSPKGTTRLSEEQIRAIVMDLYGDWYGERAAQAEIVDKGNTYEVTIPTVHKEVPKGKIRYGESYTLRIWMNAESGKIVEAHAAR